MSINKNRILVEENIISSILLKPDWKGQITLDPEAFSGPRTTIVEMINAIPASQLTEISLDKKLSRRKHDSYGGNEYVQKLWQGNPCKVYNDVDILYDELLNLEARDRIKSVSYEMMMQGDVHANPRNYMLEIASKLMPMERDHNLNIDEALESLYDVEGSFIKTHIDKFDYESNGMELGEMMVIGGAPGMGKTSVAVHIFRHTVMNDTPCAFFSLEMTERQMLQRIVCQQLRIPIARLRVNNLSDVERARIKDFLEIFKSKEFTIDCHSRTLMSITSRMRTLVERGYRMFVLDYLQLIRYSSGGNREQDVATISRELNEIAKTTNSAVIPLAQLSRAHMQRQNKRPMLSDLRESGAIEQDADIVMFPFRPNYFEVDSLQTTETLELIVAKGRNIGTGTYETCWEPQFASLGG